MVSITSVTEVISSVVSLQDTNITISGRRSYSICSFYCQIIGFPIDSHGWVTTVTITNSYSKKKTTLLDEFEIPLSFWFHWRPDIVAWQWISRYFSIKISNKPFSNTKRTLRLGVYHNWRSSSIVIGTFIFREPTAFPSVKKFWSEGLSERGNVFNGSQAQNRNNQLCGVTEKK